MEQQPSFVRWLHSQVVGDPKRKMPYSDAYEIGPLIEEAIGEEGDFDLAIIVSKLRAKGLGDEAVDQYSEALAHAEASWRIDSICYTHPEEVAAATKSEVELAPLLGVIHPPEATLLEAVLLPCGFRDLDGEVCALPSVAGAARCLSHGGAITDPAVRRSLLLIAYAKLIQGSETAVDALLEVAESSRSDMARVQAAKELLDRAGVVQDQHVHIHAEAELETEDDVLAELRKRLDSARDRLRLVAIPVHSIDSTGTDG